MSEPNVIVLVLDCLRTDAITPEDAPTLHELASQNLSAANCVTPANWSLPAHATIFTGSQPHEHHVYHREHRLTASPLVEQFSQRGYHTAGITANIYFSSSQGFDTGFDEFYETRRPLDPKGTNPFATVRRIQDGRDPSPRDYLRAFADAVTHDHPLASLRNYGQAVAIELDNRYSYRSRLPFLESDRSGRLRVASERSIDLVCDILDRCATQGCPSFQFVNLMDAHYPYEPLKEDFADVTDGDATLEDLHTMTPNLRSAREFMNTAFADAIDEDALSLVRAAYRGEIRSLDRHVERFLDDLKETGQRDQTLIVVTSDHGECLGERTLRDIRGMGHHDLLSEHLWRVPLIVANPSIDSETVEEQLSLGGLFDLLSTDTEEVLAAPKRTVREAMGRRPALFELPANPYDQDAFEAHESIPEWYVDLVATTHTVLAVDDAWRVAADSNGDVKAWREMAAVDESDAPDKLVVAAKDAVDSYPAVGDGTGVELSTDRRKQLEDLGYV